MTATAREVLSHNEGVESRDERLLEMFRELAGGRPEALEGIYELCADDLYGLALWRAGSPADAADVVQTVLVRLAERRSKLKGVRNPRSYLLAMTHRAAVDLHRRRRPERDVGDCPFLEAPADDPERRLDARRGSQLLSELPEAQREAVYLHDFAGLTFAEVGRVTGVPTFTAASRYRLGIKRLRRRMGVER
jgi:RNA polymerase sigma-70 factor (ECF subfamily)